MIVDCFQFFNELDILEIRLHALLPYVDRFILCESTFTHSNKPKPLYFQENKDRFKGFNIQHLVYEPNDNASPAGRYYNQTNFIQSALEHSDPEDTILLSDVDEIPDLGRYDGSEGVFRQRMYYYYLNCYTLHKWHGTVAIKKKNIKSLHRIRRFRSNYNKLCRGWHFSYMGDIVGKIEAFGHQELNTPEIKAKAEENKNNLVDLYGRYHKKYRISMPSGPEWLLKNKDKYEHLFYKG